MKALILVTALLVATGWAGDMDDFIGGVYKKDGFYADCGGGIAVGRGGMIAKCGDTYLTPNGSYVNAGGTYLNPNDGAIVRIGQDFVGASGFTAKAINTYLSASSASIGLKGAILTKSVLK